MKLLVNGTSHQIDAPPEMPLLWAIRDLVGLTGTKFGCGISMCGACTVHLDGNPVRSCSVPVSAAEGKSVTTVEGLAVGGVDHAVQQAWQQLNVPQCGYCQAGQLMAAAALLKTKPKPTDADIDAAMERNICRCTTYTRIRDGIHRAAAMSNAD